MNLEKNARRGHDCMLFDGLLCGCICHIIQKIKAAPPGAKAETAPPGSSVGCGGPALMMAAKSIQAQHGGGRG